MSGHAAHHRRFGNVFPFPDVAFDADEKAVIQKSVKIFQQLDVGVEIYAAVLMQGIQTHVIGDKSPQFQFVSPADEQRLPENFAELRMTVVPEHKSIIGTCLLPRTHAHSHLRVRPLFPQIDIVVKIMNNFKLYALNKRR